MDLLASLLVASIGVACIAAGYRLFCGLPALSGQRPPVSRFGVVVRNVIPGILLTLIGAGVLTAEVRGVLTHRLPVRHVQRGPGSRHSGLSHFSDRAA